MREKKSGQVAEWLRTADTHRTEYWLHGKYAHAASSHFLIVS